MAPRPLETTVRREPGLTVIGLRGEIDGFAESALDAAYAQASHAAPVLLDFGDVAYINSTGIALIIGLMKRARQDGCRLLACRLSPHYAEIFRITRLSDFIPVFPDEASAYGALPHAA